METHLRRMAGWAEKRRGWLERNSIPSLIRKSN